MQAFLERQIGTNALEQIAEWNGYLAETRNDFIAHGGKKRFAAVEDASAAYSQTANTLFADTENPNTTAAVFHVFGIKERVNSIQYSSPIGRELLTTALGVGAVAYLGMSLENMRPDYNVGRAVFVSGMGLIGMKTVSSFISSFYASDRLDKAFITSVRSDLTLGKPGITLAEQLSFENTEVVKGLRRTMLLDKALAAAALPVTIWSQSRYR